LTESKSVRQIPGGAMIPESVVFTAVIEFDTKVFLPDRLTAEWVKGVLDKSIGGPGLSIRVMTGQPFSMATGQTSFARVSAWYQGILCTALMRRDEAEKLIREGRAHWISKGNIELHGTTPFDSASKR